MSEQQSAQEKPEIVVAYSAPPAAEPPKKRTSPPSVTPQHARKILFRRVLTVLLALFMAAACLRAGHPDAFMELHPIPMIMAFVAVMPEIIHMSNNIRRCRSMTERYDTTQLHLRWALCLKSFAVIGFGLAYISKMNRKKQHFHGWHSLIGAACVGALSLQIITALLFHFRIVPANAVSLLRKSHYWTGLLVLVLGCTSIALGFSTHYGERAAGGSALLQYVFYLSAVLGCSWAYLKE